jgi:hypothetical protein
MKKYIFLLPFLITIITADTIRPRVIRGHDSVYRGEYGHSSRGSVGLSSIEASSEMSVQITSISITEASSDATSHRPHRRRRDYSELRFLEDNRLKITEDISQGGGEHLVTLLSMMRLKKDRKTLSKIQSNFDTLLGLEGKDFLSKLEEIA